ncbi:hypothetical protein CEXT_84621 [Caerostris extrusa]|uniref:Uncharacterized protein n=1 Tax=Caerostris extrusa TaxID=172846 RepID=A0AAV4XZQ0_CAEEX|nr:hypothetical protein CEXT_84621 [Caerostris extrusa]
MYCEVAPRNQMNTVASNPAFLSLHPTILSCLSAGWRTVLVMLYCSKKSNEHSGIKSSLSEPASYYPKLPIRWLENSFSYALVNPVLEKYLVYCEVAPRNQMNTVASNPVFLSLHPTILSCLSAGRRTVLVML